MTILLITAVMQAQKQYEISAEEALTHFKRLIGRI